MIRVICFFVGASIFPSLGHTRDQNCVSPSLNGPIQRSETLISQTIHATEQRMGVSGQYGLAVAVSVCGEIVWTGEYGYADLENQVPVTAETRFRVGSVSKTLTAAALGQLVEAGKLDWDGEIQTYVPAFPRKRYLVTVRQVAGHVGGIRHYAGNEFMSDVRYETINDALAVFKNDPLLSEPGTEYNYSSYGWNLLSAVVEGASGQSFLDYMKVRVFEPAGMSSTLADDNLTLIPNRTQFYHFDEAEETNGNAPYVDNSIKWAGGGFLSTPSDILRFGRAIYDGTLVNEDTQNLLVTGMTTRDGADTGYGIGWSTDMLNRELDRAEDHFPQEVLDRTRALIGDHRIAGHSGGSVGGLTLFLTTPDLDGRVMIAATSNNSSIFPVFTLPVFAEFVGISTQMGQ